MSADDPARRHSIVGRSTGFTIVFVAAHGLGYALMLAANYLLDGHGFAGFYTTWVAITVVTAPASAVLVVLGRLLTDAAVTHGRAAVARLTLGLVRRSLAWGVPAALLAAAALAAAFAAGGENWAVPALIPLVALTLIVSDLVRTAFQALLLFGRSGAMLLVSHVAQLVLAVPAIALFRLVWPGFIGVLAGTAIVCAAYLPWFSRAARTAPAGAGERLPLRLGRETRLIASYSLFVLINNIDVLLGSVLMPRDALAVYAASALLPKAIVLATLPVTQIVLPIIVEQHAGGAPTHKASLTAVTLVLGMAAAAAAVLWFALPLIQATPLAVRGLDIALTRLLALGAVGLSAARVLLVAEIALGRYAIALIEAAAAVLFTAAAIVAGRQPWALGVIGTAVCWLFFAAAAAALRTAHAERPPGRA